MSSETVKLWGVPGDKEGVESIAWLGDGMGLVGKARSCTVRISILQEDFMEGAGAPKFLLEYKAANSSYVRRITHYSLAEVLKAFSSFHKSLRNIFRAREALFGNHWLSEILRSDVLKPVSLKNELKPLGLEKEVIFAQKAIIQSEEYSALEFTVAHPFAARNRVVTENYIVDICSMSAKSQILGEKQFVFSVEFDGIKKERVVVLRCGDRNACLKAPFFFSLDA